MWMVVVQPVSNSPTSGTACGLHCSIYMPDDQAKEKSDLLSTFGATVRRVKPVSIVNERHYVNLARKEAQHEPGLLCHRKWQGIPC